MESGITNESKPVLSETQNVVNTDSTDSFQTFIYELFEKNGILNDLRAYLRGHIINVLKSAQTELMLRHHNMPVNDLSSLPSNDSSSQNLILASTNGVLDCGNSIKRHFIFAGDPPPCQKNFTQRLDLTFQALNMLIAEYLLRLEFSYSFSVFVSEIPLANMVFGFAKTLMEKVDENNTNLRFKEADVWSILNYLGVQCDSEHASNIVKMYNDNQENQHPLLLCILKGMPMYNDHVKSTQSMSDESVASTKTLESADNEAPNKRNMSMPECSHFVYCKKCQNKIYKLKDKYKNKKKNLDKNVKNKDNTNISPAKSDSLVKNISVMERTLIEEMFQQLKSVYETEVEMLKAEEDKKVKRSIATHAMQLQQKRNELEEAYKVREMELERSVQHKKKFLWGLARSLRDQHQHMTRAMCDVRAETERLEVKEDSLKNQLAEAEQILKKRGEEMRLQISNELAILEGHLESMKRERETITRERSELDNLRTAQDTNKGPKVHSMESEEVHSHYDLLKNELAILKTFLKSSQMQAKCVIERGTITESCEQFSQINVALNNSQGNEKCSKSDDYDERVKMNQVVNDFRKKNVNFSQSNLDEIYHERSRERSRSSNSSEAGDTAAPDLELERVRDRDLIQRLRDENDRLKAFARHRCSHMSAACVRYMPRPHTAPPPAPYHNNVHMFNLNTVSASTLNVGWRKGAGEELSMFSNAQPRILVPGDTLPFIGVLRDRHGISRRSQSGGRTRAALGGVNKRAASPARTRDPTGAGSSGQGLRSSGAHLPVASCSLQPDDNYQILNVPQQQLSRPTLSLDNRNRDKSPKSLLKEAKDKLRRKDSNKASTMLPRDKSPNSVLREAKQRLRKLEIEAEAVEKSYLDFRRRQSGLRVERARDSLVACDGLAKALDVTRSHSTQELDETTRDDIEAQFADLQKSVRGDFDKYIREYKNKFDIGMTHFRNKPTVAEKVKPIPDSYVADCKDNVDPHGNYLETPLTEFRKLYSVTRQTRRDEDEVIKPPRSVHSDDSISENKFDYENSARNDALRKVKHNKQAELQILKQNISKIYQLPNDNVDFVATGQHDNENYLAPTEDENNLRVEVESICQINDIKSQSQDMMLVVQSSVNSRDVERSGHELPTQEFSAQMTIIVSPKRPRSESRHGDAAQDGGLCMTPERPRRSVSPEQAAHLTRTDVLDAIFRSDPNNDVSSVQMQLELSKDDGDSISEYEKRYSGDFDADVDNYNTHSEDDENTPISQPVMTEDENFWES